MDNTHSSDSSIGVQATHDMVEELLDKQRLHDNMALYCRAMDRKDLATMKSTFWPEATDNHGSFVGLAHDFCEWTYENQKHHKHRSHHYITNVLSEVDGSTAHRESAVIYVMVRPAENRIELMGGRYRDFCEKRQGEWRVLRRTVVFDYAQVFPSIADFGDVFGGIPPTATFGSLFPEDAIYDAQW